jgi:signal transduction histidine kinase
MRASNIEPSLSEFLRTNAEDILRLWDEFAAGVSIPGSALDARSLRDHSTEILSTVAADMEQPQSQQQQRAKSRGEPRSIPGQEDTAAQTHADSRIAAGFGILPLMTEYRALRASVLYLWAQSHPTPMSSEVEQITRFNEAIDQAIIESVARYVDRTKQSTDLFIGVLGHDIRNPLSTIAMSMKVLGSSQRLDEAAERRILNSVDRIKSIIEQIVDFTRAQAGSAMPIVCTQADLAAHAEEIVEETRVRHPGVSVAVQREGGDFQGCWDKGRIGQLFSNLLANAIQYGDRARPVTVRLAGGDPEITVEVRNYGPVIPAPECSRIFDPLVRGSVARTQHERAGLGLGLYICREIVRAHGGRIEARSDQFEGTRFIVHLPRNSRGGELTEEQAKSRT